MRATDLESAEPGNRRTVSRRPFVVVFVGLALTAVLGTGVFRMREGPAIEAGTSEQLSAIADLKARQIESWLWERRGDLVVASRGSLAAPLTAGGTQPAVSAETRQRLRTILETRQYRDILL